jgi:hypothetical protein
MKRQLAFAVVVIFALCSSGCGDSHDSLTKESVSAMTEMVGVLDGVKDAASAKSAKDKLKAVAAKLKDIQQRESKLPTITEAEFKSMGDKYGKQMEELQMKLAAHMMRIGFDPAIRAELDDINLK